MSKIKVKINQAEPPREVIRKYKSYPSFMDTYKKLHTSRGIGEMFFKDKTKLSMIVVFLVLILLWVLGYF